MGLQDLPGGVVITGGVAKLEGIAQLAQTYFANESPTLYTGLYRCP